MDWLAFLEQFLRFLPSVPAAALLVAVLVDLAKFVGLPDGYGGLAALVLNAVAYIVIAVFGEGAVAPWIEVLVPILTALLALLTSGLIHKGGVKLGLFPFNSHPARL